MLQAFHIKDANILEKANPEIFNVYTPIVVVDVASVETLLRI